MPSFTLSIPTRYVHTVNEMAAISDIANLGLKAEIFAFAEPADKAQQLVLALADRCFAAAFFRYHSLA